MSLGTLSLLDGDHTLLIDLAHRLSDQLTDICVVVSRDGCNLLDLSDVLTDSLALLFERLNDRSNSLVDTALQIHRVCTCGYILQTDTDDSLSQHGCGRRTVTCVVVGLRSNLLNHLRTHICERVLQLDLLSNRNTVLGYLRSTELLVDDHVTTLRTERYLHCIAQRIDTLFEQLARLNIIFNLFCHSFVLSFLRIR